jgi:hypothetical protein
VLGVIRGIINTYVGIWKSIISGAMDAIKATIKTVMDVVKAIFRGDFGAVVDIVRNKISDLIGLVKGIPSKIVKALGNMGRLLFSKGKDLIQGFIDGIKSINIGNIIGGIIDKINPFSLPPSVAGLPTPYIGPTMSNFSTRSAPSARNFPTSISVTLNGGDPYTTARVVKRALEGYDITQGRARGEALAVAW